MKPFDTLTERGRARRLRRLALAALQQYPAVYRPEYHWQVSDLRLVGLFTNAIFRLRCTLRPRTREGESYTVRICQPGWRTDTDLQSEVLWLQALGRIPELNVPVPVAACDGSYIVTAVAAGVPEPRRCMIQSWSPGVLLGKRLNEANLYKMGELFARLHAASLEFDPPPGFTQRKLDTLYARGEEDILFQEAARQAFTDQTRTIFERTWVRVQQAYRQLYADPNGLRVIHNDLWHDNIKIYRGRLYPFDFEDTAWGYPVQDIAMALEDLMMDIEPEAYEPLSGAFRRGYESLAIWPEQYDGQIDTFRAGRLIWVANYVARFERPHLPGFIERVAPLLERFLDSGKLRRGG